MVKIANNKITDVDSGTADTDYLRMSQGVSFWKSATIDGLATGNTVLIPAYTATKYGLFWLSSGVLLVSVSGAGTVPTISVGTNASTYDNIITAGAITGLTVANTILSVPLTTPSRVLLTSAVYVRVSVAAIGFSAYNFQVVLMGIALDT